MTIMQQTQKPKPHFSCLVASGASVGSSAGIIASNRIMSGGATTTYRNLLKAIKKHIGNEDYKRHFKDFVTLEFRKNHNLSSIQQNLTLANNYTFLLNSVHHHKELLFSYNIAVDRSEEMRRVLGKSAASVGLRLPEVYQS